MGGGENTPTILFFLNRKLLFIDLKPGTYTFEKAKKRIEYYVTFSTDIII